MTKKVRTAKGVKLHLYRVKRCHAVRSVGPMVDAMRARLAHVPEINLSSKA